jgi:hypothetical protein
MTPKEDRLVKENKNIKIINKILATQKVGNEPKNSQPTKVKIKEKTNLIIKLQKIKRLEVVPPVSSSYDH